MKIKNKSPTQKWNQWQNDNKTIESQQFVPEKNLN